MANISSSGFRNKVLSYINNFATNQVVWHSTNHPGSNYIITGALSSPSRPFQGEAPSGTISVNAILASIRLNAYYSSSIRRARAGRLTNAFGKGGRANSGNFKTNNDQIRVAALRAPFSGTLYDASVYPARAYSTTTDWRQNLPRNLEALARQFLVEAGREVSESKLNQFLAEVQKDLNALINSSAVVDLRACHSNCHSDCHRNRTRR